MRKIKWIFLFVFLLGIAACSSDEEDLQVEEEKETVEVNETEEKVEQSKQELAQQLLDEDLAWMEEKNVNLHFPYEPHIITYDTHEAIGTYVQYNIGETDFDTGRYPLFVSFHGEQYQFELGWTGPNLHTLSYSELTDKVREKREGWLDQPFSPFIDDMGFGVAPSDWQMTAADVDGDGMLDLIISARHIEEDGIFHEKILAVYRYTGQQEEPFELAAHVKTASKGYRNGIARQFLYTQGKEFIAEDWDFEEAVIYFEEGNWYVNTNQFITVEENLSTANLLVSDFGEKDEFINKRVPAPYIETCYTPWADERVDKQTIASSDASNQSFTPTVPKKEEMELEGVLKDLPESCQHLPTPCEPLSNQDIKERAAAAAIFYIEKSILARKEGDYSIASPYIASGSPIAEEMLMLVPSDASRGVSMTFEQFEVIDVVEVVNDVYNVSLRNVYDIQGTKKTGLRTFESTLQIVYDISTDEFYAYQLLEEREL